MPHTPFRAIDSDNHYYEAPDAFTRHLPPGMGSRTMQWAEIGGRTRLLVGGRINRFIPNPLFDPVAKPGILDEFFRGRNPEAKSVAEQFGELEPIRPEYRNPDARLSVMDGQGLEAALLFPTLGVGMEEALRDDLQAVVVAFRAFNRWLAEDWGFHYQERLFAAPYLTLVDVDEAVREVEWIIEQGGRVVCLRPGPVPTPTGSRSLGHPDYDPVWARLAEAGVLVGFHGGDAGYTRYVDDWEPTGLIQSFSYSPFKSVVLSDRFIYDTMAALICHGVFDRVPALRVASIETGASWVVPLLTKLKKVYGQLPQTFGSDPVDRLRANVWVSPYYEDDLAALKEAVGSEHILFGSDWPHAEGLTEPTSFVHDLTRCGFDATEVRRVMRDNAMGLISEAVGAPA